jgi:hypothetical protein
MGFATPVRLVPINRLPKRSVDPVGVDMDNQWARVRILQRDRINPAFVLNIVSLNDVAIRIEKVSDVIVFDDGSRKRQSTLQTFEP